MDTGPLLVNLFSVSHPSSHTRDTGQALELSPWSQVTWCTASCVYSHLCFFSQAWTPESGVYIMD